MFGAQCGKSSRLRDEIVVADAAGVTDEPLYCPFRKVYEGRGFRSARGEDSGPLVLTILDRSRPSEVADRPQEQPFGTVVRAAGSVVPVIGLAVRVIGTARRTIGSAVPIAGCVELVLHPAERARRFARRTARSESARARFAVPTAGKPERVAGFAERVPPEAAVPGWPPEASG
jgi:hypothetical protein